MIHTAYLIVSSNGSMRVVKQRPHLAINEVAFTLKVELPTPRKILGDILLTVPPPPDAGIEIDPEIYDALVPREPEPS